MIKLNCDKCLKEIFEWAWHNNQRLCNTCRHMTRPSTHRCRDTECKAPTWDDVKNYLEKN